MSPKAYEKTAAQMTIHATNWRFERNFNCRETKNKTTTANNSAIGVRISESILRMAKSGTKTRAQKNTPQTMRGIMNVAQKNFLRSEEVSGISVIPCQDIFNFNLFFKIWFCLLRELNYFTVIHRKHKTRSGNQPFENSINRLKEERKLAFAFFTFGNHALSSKPGI